MKNLIKQKGLKNHIVNNKNCMDCGKKVRKFRSYKNKFLCYNCYIKKLHRIEISRNYNRISFEKAINRIYEVKGYVTKKGYIKAMSSSFPNCLIGHKFKIQIIEKEEK